MKLCRVILGRNLTWIGRELVRYHKITHIVVSLCLGFEQILWRVFRELKDRYRTKGSNRILPAKIEKAVLWTAFLIFEDKVIGEYPRVRRIG